MRRYLIPIVAILMLASGLVVGCAADLPENEQEVWFSSGIMYGYSWGYWLTFEDPDLPILWTPPDKVDEVQQLYETDIRKMYIPKGYLTMEGFSDAHFPDGTPYNEKQKGQAVESYNWGFYAGFRQGSEDCLDGKPNRYHYRP